MEIKLEPYKNNRELKERISNGVDICSNCGAADIRLRTWFIDCHNNKKYYPKLNKLTSSIHLCIKCFPSDAQENEESAARIIIPLLENRL